MADISMQYVAGMRQYLRINHTRFDAEITDLLLGGISEKKVNDESDALIKRAIVVYVKAEFGLDNADGDKYRESYGMLKRHLMLSSEYTEEA